MITRKTIMIFVALLVVSLIAVGLVQAADDGPLFRRNISRTPETMTGASQFSVMPLYVPAQNTQGTLVAIEYLMDDGNIAYSMTEAKPLFATYNDGIEDEELNALLGINAINTGAGFGERDAFAALSLDDGATWKNYNLSDSAARSSFVLRDGHEYPGDVFKIMHAVEGNRVAVAWISRFCSSGSPLYSWTPEDQLALAETYGLGQLVSVDGVDYNTYSSDLFGVAGSQKSVDYTLQGFPEVGEVPYGCVWVARGTLEEDPLSPGVYDITWRAGERLTSGRRDANRVEITSAPGAGFIISWQEDPEGLRPGKGLGPGEGWSGAIANSKTDIWYTYIDWDHFDDVCLDEPESGLCTAGTLEGYTDTVKPKAAIPFAVPMRLTDNNLCKADVDPTNQGYLPYCYADFNGNGTADLCAESLSWTNPGGTTLNVCKAEDGRMLTGRTASTRVRWALKPYTTNVDADGDGANDISAWVVMAEEKMKALGSELDVDLEPIDIGKDMWYHTFDMFQPELVQQGLMLNSPALDPLTGDELPIYVDEWGNNYHETEIARRFNLMVQGSGAALASDFNTSAILIYKEGIINQGGPADIFIRRVVLPETFDPAVDNPFAYENVQCAGIAEDGTTTPTELLYADGSNANYVHGLCPVRGMNMSGTTIVACDGVAGDCASSFPWESDDTTQDFPKVTEWVQTEANFNDPSWANPYDVSKGHRGFIDGDFVMLMYATAPNWKANTTGNEAYNLYIRRSFDGGQTWTTLPDSYTHINGVSYNGDGTTTCEDYGWGGLYETEVCTTYAAGAFEQARNVSRLTGTKITVLDPRYSPTGGMLKTDFTNLLCYDGTDWTNCGYTEAPYPEEIRDPSGYFVTYETGDNTVVSVETGAVPMDMYYARAFNFGDDYDEIEFTTSSGQLVTRWDWLENGPELATEASVYGNPDGSKFYAVWNQELEIALDVFTDMDAQFRRIFYNFTTDAYPSASILYVSDYALDQSKNEVLRLIGAGRDNDRLGKAAHEVKSLWTDERGAIYCKIDDYDEDGNPIYECEKETEIKAGELERGMNKIHFRVQDDEGNWSLDATVDIFVAEHLYQVHLPAIER